MARNQTWFSPVKNIFENSPLASSTFFVFILACLEKFLEVEFACPCDPKLNAWFAAAFFFGPAFMVFMLMMNIQGFKRDNYSEMCVNLLISLVPAIVWLIFMFLDGQYLVCGWTSWSGRFVDIDGATGQKWCKPNETSHDLKSKTQHWFALSQWIGMGMVIFLGFALGPYLAYRCFKEEESATQHSDGQELPERTRMHRS